MSKLYLNLRKPSKYVLNKIKKKKQIFVIYFYKVFVLFNVELISSAECKTIPSPGNYKRILDGLVIFSINSTAWVM